MKRTATACILTELLMVSACNSDSRDDEGGVTLAGFESRVRANAGAEAEACGTVEIGQSEVDVNTCLAEAFTNGTDAYAVVRQQGTDSLVASATTVRDGGVTFHSFDSDPTGGGASDNGRIDVSTCPEPRLSGSVDGFDVFLCTEQQPSSPMGGSGITFPLAGNTWLWSGCRSSSGAELVVVVSRCRRPATTWALIDTPCPSTWSEGHGKFISDVSRR